MINSHLAPSLRSKALIAASFLAAVLCLPALGQGETVQVPVGQQAKQKAGVDRPSTGMQQSRVEELYGTPIDWREAVGEPPISTWIYPDFEVYFEYDRVIHTVLKHTEQPVASTGTADE